MDCKFAAQCSTLPTLGESLVLVAAWSRQEGTGGGFFWISSLKQVEKWAGAGSEAWPFFLNVRLSFSAALQRNREVACYSTGTCGVTRKRHVAALRTHSNAVYFASVRNLFLPG